MHFVEKARTVDRLRGKENLGWPEFARRYPGGLPDHEISADELQRMARLMRPVLSIHAIVDDGDEDCVVMSPLVGEVDGSSA